MREKSGVGVGVEEYLLDGRQVYIHQNIFL